MALEGRMRPQSPDAERPGLSRSDSSPAIPRAGDSELGVQPPVALPAPLPPAGRGGHFERSRSQPHMRLTQGDDDYTGQPQMAQYDQAGDADGDVLDSEWTIWFDKSNKRPRQKNKGGRNIYDDCIVELGSFNTVGGYMAYWESLHVHNLKDHCNLRVFRKGIKPLWEDPHNRDGGKWVVRGVPKENRRDLWTTMVTALVKGHLCPDNRQTVCGVVLSTRDSGDSMQLWVAGQVPQDTQTPATLRSLLFPSEPGEFANFIFQTHRELQHPSSRSARDSEAAVQEAAAAAAAAHSSPVPQMQHHHQDFGSPDGVPMSPTAWQGQQVQQQQMEQQAMVDTQQDQFVQHHPQQPQQMQPMGMQQFGMQMLPTGVMGTHMMVGGQMMPVMMQGQPMLMNVGQFPSPTMPAVTFPAGGHMSPTMPAAAPQQGSSGRRGRGGRGGGPMPDAFSDEDDDEDPLVSIEGADQFDVQAVQQIQERAKQIRTIRKRIRYVNFFLPFLQRELQLLEEQQQRDVEQQKARLGVDSLDFLRKPQQPMTYSNEAERRFKTMRAIRKKIRFIHYHLERQRAGKMLSAAEVAKVNALPEFEARLAELEAEEEAENGQRDGGAGGAAGVGAVGSFGSSGIALSPSADAMQSPAWPSGGEGSQLSPHGTPQQLPAAGAGISITELQSQIEQQKRELEEKQKHIERLLQQQTMSPQRGARPPGRGPASPGPPPLGSPSMGPQQGLPLSPCAGMHSPKMMVPGGAVVPVHMTGEC
eukprot:TRINITY_DN1235_c1_g1_i3.p1 TRINITY_DN1235_c1_g1~~TRINITY_DN1235_c1_g1_i3.p1  ORF type:complete len:802 (+),score=275.50 TRINITY_DN1235_c1_g1_i3:143-2407(+)